MNRLPDRVELAQRLFVALFPPPPVQAAIGVHCNDWQWPQGVRLVKPARIHLTLHFLGKVDAARVPEVISALSAVEMAPIELSVRTPQIWRRNGVAVVCPDPHPGLDRLHRAVVDALQCRGLAYPDERWKPHLTIAHRAAQAQAPHVMAPIRWLAREFALVRSRLAPPVSRYEILARRPS